ncbi:MAG: methylenetetrahydrofolate reductase [NAD(P)H] [Bacteroidales bacterium]|nr:methylenetetrahydrofolate reductase [NAD(P)H] [Bacteroidales bacterium]MBN2757909.1 methylenetetrahydrofolate reductase [NAD(P)H] [Bacteroidales bacterium]
MKVIDHINNSKKTMFSFEILPPLKGKDINLIYEVIDPLMEFNPKYVNITYHREEVVYKRHKTGLLEKKTVHKRPGTVAIAAAIKYKYNDVNVVPHIICGGFSKEETENALIDLHFLGIRNLLVLRGDPLSADKEFMPEQNGHSHAIELINQIQNLNKGVYLDEELENTTKMDFSFGVAGYPEKHFESPNIETDLKYLKDKIKAGAGYIVTQMFFDNKKYFDFVDLCRENDINVPIIPGLKPISIQKHLTILPSTFSIDIPKALSNELVKCKNNDAVRQVGVEWAIEQSKELIAKNAPAVHYYTMGKADNIYKIAKAVF